MHYISESPKKMVSLYEFLNFQAQVQFVLSCDLLPYETKESLKRLLQFSPGSQGNRMAREYLCSVAEALDFFLSHKYVLTMLHSFVEGLGSSKATIIQLVINNFHIICNQSAIHNYIQYYNQPGESKLTARAVHPLVHFVKTLLIMNGNKTSRKTDQAVFDHYFEEFLKSINEDNEEVQEFVSNLQKARSEEEIPESNNPNEPESNNTNEPEFNMNFGINATEPVFGEGISGITVDYEDTQPSIDESSKSSIEETETISHFKRFSDNFLQENENEPEIVPPPVHNFKVYSDSSDEDED